MLKLRTSLCFVVVITAVAAFSSSGYAQSPSTPNDWETLRPEGEEFGILMPKNSTSEKSEEPYHRMTLNTRLYLSSNPAGPVFAVASFSGIKSNPAMYTEMARVNSYVDAFKRWFPKKIRGKDAVAKLTLTRETTLNGHQGREYRMVIGDLSGIMQAFATKRRFYAIVALNTKKDDALSEHFLSSFQLPERVVEPPPQVAEQQKVEKPAGDEKTLEDDQTASADGQKLDGEHAQSSGDQKPDATAGVAKTGGEETKPAGDGKVGPIDVKKTPISGGVLNGKAIVLPKPDYPAEARTARISGTVVVQVTIDEYGNVAAAKAVSGHPMLQQVSVNAALMARFNPTFLMGEAVKVTGVLTYNFVAQ